jgi:hypothetical protein
VDRVGHWTPNRWAVPPTKEPAAASRAELILGLAQYLADAGADAEGRPRRVVPRLEHDTALTDQIRVLAADLLLAPVSVAVLGEAVTAVRAATRAL